MVQIPTFFVIKFPLLQGRFKHATYHMIAIKTEMVDS